MKNDLLLPESVRQNDFIAELDFKCRSWQFEHEKNLKNSSASMSNKATTKYNLQACNPTIAKEWHPTKNGSVTPKDVTAGSGKKVWWQCPKGHEWEAPLCRRNNGHGCPYCSGNKVSPENCLQTVNPSLAKEWHPTKNVSLTPKDVTVGSHKKAWWQCSRGHEWNAVVKSRSKGNGCPYCHSQTSLLELKVYTEMKFLFPDAEHRKKSMESNAMYFFPV